MNYKKLFVGLLAVGVCGFVVWNIAKSHRKTPQASQAVAIKSTQSSAKITFILNTGASIATYDGVLAATPFDALTKISTSQSLTIEKKQYDFGVFVEKIGNFANTKDNAWIYYVNGVSGEMAADKKILKNGDIVEWRYTKPLY